MTHSYEVLDAQGKVVIPAKNRGQIYENETVTVPLNGLRRGLYTIKLTTEDDNGPADQLPLKFFVP